MYKLIVIEDEMIEREGLVRLTDWKSLGIEVVYAACDGLEGYRKCCEIKPDIVIADIRMPGMSGLELLKRIKMILPDIKSVIVSGYNDFDYAREAIGLNASSYIVKPFEEKELVPVLQAIVQELDRNRRENEERLLLSNKLREYDLNSRNNLILQLMQKKRDFAGAKADLAKWNIPLTDAYMVSAVFKVYGSFLDVKKSVLFKKDLEEAAKKYLNDKAIVLDINEELTGILFISAARGQDCPDRTLISENVRNLYKSIRIGSGDDLRVGIGYPVNDITLLHQTYNMALAALGIAFHNPEKRIVFYEDIKSSHEQYNTVRNKVIFDISHYKSKLLFSIKSFDRPNMYAVQRELLHYAGMNLIPENDLKEFFSRFIYELSFALYEMNEEINHICGKEGELTDELNSLSCFAQLDAWSNRQLSGILDGMEASRTGRSESLVQKVVDIIKDEYRNGISIRTISDTISISPNYLGAIFRKGTGKNFNEYLTEYRMEKAKELLKSRKYKIAQVGAMVGIPNESYFCVVFKNVVGISPGNYQEVV